MTADGDGWGAFIVLLVCRVICNVGHFLSNVKCLFFCLKPDKMALKTLHPCPQALKKG